MTNRLRPAFTHACGALGRYDRDVVDAIARRFDAETTVAHEDRRSILRLDRPPVRWRGRRARGVAWTETLHDPPDAVRNWREAATSGASCGLVVEGRNRYLHSSVSGVAPLYYLEGDGAVYFASRIDALVGARPRLSVDWDAWASILTLDYPVGNRTPFVEIKRLPPFSLLRCGSGRANVEEVRWPWAEVDPVLGVDAGAPAVVDSLREAIARVPAGPVICQLSGGLDSRLCLALLAERRRDDVTALTVDPDTPHERDLRMSARIAETVGVPHEIVVGAPEDYWPQFQTRSLRVDYQFVRSPWRMPKRRRLEEAAAPVVDGFGFDTLAVPGERFLMRDAVAPSGDDAVVKALWARLRAKQAGGTASSLRHSLAQALWTSTRRQFLRESKRFEGHPARAILTLYWTRQVRGISQTPFAILGNDIPLAMPLIDDSVARNTLAISPASKFGRHLYTAVFEAIEPRLTDLPFTSGGKDAPRDPGRRDRRSQTVDVADAMRAALESGPMADWVRPRGPHLLRRHQRGRPARTSRNLLGPALFNLWHQRYRNVLGEIDPADVIERD